MYDKSKTPEEIAHTLFIKDPEIPNSQRIISDDSENYDIINVFEILLQILFEGFNILTNGFDDTDINNITYEHILSLNPWMNSLGFNLNVETFDKNQTYLYNKYYCRALIKTMNDNIKNEFNKRNIQKNYHFFINKYYCDNNIDDRELDELYAIIETNNCVFKIYFRSY